MSLLYNPEIHAHAQDNAINMLAAVHHASPPLATPPPKRRRGRPPKCPQGLDVESPAAHLSAAVLKQGTPKASSPLMRISPVRSSKPSNRSPLQRKVNPSPKGGTLMTLQNFSPIKGRPAHTSSKPKTNAFYRMTPHTVSLHAQQNIQSLTNDQSEHSINVSVNPSLLLSSPISANKIDELNKSRVPVDLKPTTELKRVVKQNLSLASSPMTPAASSCFSSIMQSSPLYQGYYVNQTSPDASILGSSPVRFQVRPMDIPELKPVIQQTTFNLKTITELPTNPSNSPNLKPRDPSPKTLAPKMFDQYRLSMCIDENGQARITKTFTGKPKQPIFAAEHTPRHQSLSALTFSKNNLSHEFSMFVEPSKVADGFFFSDLDDHLGFDVTMTPVQQQGPTFMNREDDKDFSNGTTSDEDLLDDDVMNSDARNALVKMIRRSI